MQIACKGRDRKATEVDSSSNGNITSVEPSQHSILVTHTVQSKGASQIEQWDELSSVHQRDRHVMTIGKYDNVDSSILITVVNN